MPPLKVASPPVGSSLPSSQVAFPLLTDISLSLFSRIYRFPSSHGQNPCGAPLGHISHTSQWCPFRGNKKRPQHFEDMKPLLMDHVAFAWDQVASPLPQGRATTFLMSPYLRLADQDLVLISKCYSLGHNKTKCDSLGHNKTSSNGESQSVTLQERSSFPAAGKGKKRPPL